MFSLFFLLSCIFKHHSIEILESPCIDGTHANIKNSKCLLIDWGTNSTGDVLKIRCTLSYDDSWWNKASFYVVHHENKDIRKSWKHFCLDRSVKMFVEPPVSRK